MASPQPPATDQPLPEAHQAGQVAIAALVAYAIAKLWPDLDLAHLRSSLPAFKAAVAQEVIRHSQMAGSLAVQQYGDQRVLAGVRGGFRAVAADPPSVAQIAAEVDWATQPLWNAAVKAHGAAGGHADNAPTDVKGSSSGTTRTSAGSAIADAKARLAGAGERLVGDTGARTIIENVANDRQAKGYARVPEPDACSFCLMLAINSVARGPGGPHGVLYKTDRAHGAGDSFAVSNAKFKDGKVPSSIKVHDNCRCHPEPIFNAYEPSARVRQADALWRESTKGYGGKAARNRFRQAVEGRLPTDD